MTNGIDYQTLLKKYIAYSLDAHGVFLGGGEFNGPIYGISAEEWAEIQRLQREVDAEDTARRNQS